VLPFAMVNKDIQRVHKNAP